MTLLRVGIGAGIEVCIVGNIVDTDDEDLETKVEYGNSVSSNRTWRDI